MYSALCSGLLCAGLALSEGGVELLDLPVACAVVGVASGCGLCVCVCESVAVKCLTVLLDYADAACKWRVLCGPIFRRGVHGRKGIYSGTSVSGPSQQRPTSLQRPKRRVRIDFSIDLTHFEPPNNGNGNLQTPASGQRPGSGTLYFRRKLPPRTAKFKTTPLFVKPHPLIVRRIHCNIHPYKGHLSTRAKRSDPKVALLRRFHCRAIYAIIF